MHFSLVDHFYFKPGAGAPDAQRDRKDGGSSAALVRNGKPPAQPCDIGADSASDRARFECDVSYIGTWSPKKESLLSELLIRRSHLRLRIWGSQWSRSKSPVLRNSIVGHAVLGEDFVRLQDSYSRQNDTASLQKYAELYRADKGK